MPIRPDPVLLLLLQTGLTFFMTGLIWFVQVVHYPLFADVGRSEFSAYEKRHMQRISWLVGPVMLAEAASAAGLLWLAPAQVSRSLLIVNFGLIGIIWVSTAVWQVPEHEHLRQGFCPEAASRLVRTNWVRTIGWTARCLLLTYAALPAVVATIALAPSGISPR